MAKRDMPLRWDRKMQQRLAQRRGRRPGRADDRFASLVHGLAHRRSTTSGPPTASRATSSRTSGSIPTPTTPGRARCAPGSPASPTASPSSGRARPRRRPSSGAGRAPRRSWRPKCGTPRSPPAPTTSCSPCRLRCAPRWSWPTSSAATTARPPPTSVSRRTSIRRPPAPGPPAPVHRPRRRHRPAPARGPARIRGCGMTAYDATTRTTATSGTGRRGSRGRAGATGPGPGTRARIPLPRASVEDGGRVLPDPAPAALEHQVLTSLLGAWALAACSAQEAAAVEDHLEECEACAEEALRLREAVALLQRPESLDLSLALRTRVLDGVPGAASAPHPGARVGHPLRRRDRAPRTAPPRGLRGRRVARPGPGPACGRTLPECSRHVRQRTPLFSAPPAGRR
ncbi:hypothetical protein STENM327S_02664 [Streptomyces tendae]